MNRRDALAQFAGAIAAFAGCGLARPAHAQGQQAPRRREVVVSGKRVKTIDIHAHCHFREALALMDLRENNRALFITEDRVKAMDEQGIDVEALSISPIFWHSADPDLARRVVKLQNEQLAEICAREPERFVGLASVALQHPQIAAEQLQDAVARLGLRGALIAASVNDEDLAEEKFHPFWAKAEELGVLVFIHPQTNPEVPGTRRMRGEGALDSVIGNPLEMTIALSHLIFEGTLDAYPGLKVCAALGGGYLPSYAGRSDRGCLAFPGRCSKPLKKQPSEYLKQLYYDSIVFTGEGLRHLAAEVGAGQIMMGTDAPFPWTNTAVDHILETPGLSDEDRIAMLGGTAAKLLDIKT
jgi:aminocarboxymuconate-semialdehyde decarboxylase